VLIWINEARLRRIMTSAPRLALSLPWDARPLSSQVRQLDLGLCILSMILLPRESLIETGYAARSSPLTSFCNKV
jgi:hypothetical protein